MGSPVSATEGHAGLVAEVVELNLAALPGDACARWKAQLALPLPSGVIAQTHVGAGIRLPPCSRVIMKASIATAGYHRNSGSSRNTWRVPSLHLWLSAVK